jgi:predicted O-methyltransferase YrrM
MRIRSLVWKVPPLKRVLVERDNLREELRTLKRERDALTEAAEALRGERDALHSEVSRVRTFTIETDYPYDPVPRALEASPGGQVLTGMFKGSIPAIEDFMRVIASFKDDLSRIPPRGTGVHWCNDFLPALDGASIYALIASKKPRRYIEVGCGMSTRFAARAIAEHGLGTKIVGIDPEPRSDVAELCSELIRQPLEEIGSSFWQTVEANDLVFFDGSHRSFQNSDVTVFFTEIVPRLPAGTIYGIHDICLPFDYPSDWARRFYNEQYLLAAYLLGGASGDQILFPAMWASSRPELHQMLAPLWQSPNLRDAETHGGAFWLRKS